MDPDSLNSIRIRIRFWIQGFDHEKWKKYSRKKNVIKNCNLLIPRPPWRTSKLQEMPSENEIYDFFLFLWALLDPDPQHRLFSLQLFSFSYFLIPFSIFLFTTIDFLGVSRRLFRHICCGRHWQLCRPPYPSDPGVLRSVRTPRNCLFFINLQHHISLWKNMRFFAPLQTLGSAVVDPTSCSAALGRRCTSTRELTIALRFLSSWVTE